jgi:ankyrin repeat protein
MSYYEQTMVSQNAEHSFLKQYETIEERLVTEILKPTIHSLPKIDKYLSKKIDLEKVYKYGNNAIHHAAKLGRRRVLEMLVKAGSDPAMTNYIGQTPLMIASRGTTRKHSSCVKFLLTLSTNSCNVNAIDHEGRTALRQAILGSNVKSVDLLLKHGSDLSWDEHTVLCSHYKSEPIAPAFARSLSLNQRKVVQKLPKAIRKMISANEKIVLLLQSHLKGKEDDTDSVSLSRKKDRNRKKIVESVTSTDELCCSTSIDKKTKKKRKQYRFVKD